MRRTNGMIGALAMALLFTGGLRAEHDMGKDGDHEMEGRFEKMKTELGLSEEQAKQLKEHKKGQREKQKANWEAMKAKREALNAELEKPKVDESRVKALHAELQAIQNKMGDERMQAILEVRKILTPEQFKKFQEMKEKHEGPMGRRGMEHKGSKGSEKKK